MLLVSMLLYTQLERLNMPPNTLISKKIRPGLLVWFSLFFTVIALADGNVADFTVKEIYIKVLETILGIMFGAYFLGKSGERIVDMQTKRQESENVVE